MSLSGTDQNSEPNLDPSRCIDEQCYRLAQPDPPFNLCVAFIHVRVMAL